MIVRDLSQYSVMFTTHTSREAHREELLRLSKAVQGGDVEVDGDLIQDHVTSNTYLYIRSWKSLQQTICLPQREVVPDARLREPSFA